MVCYTASCDLNMRSDPNAPATPLNKDPRGGMALRSMDRVEFKAQNQHLREQLALARQNSGNLKKENQRLQQMLAMEQNARKSETSEGLSTDVDQCSDFEVLIHKHCMDNNLRVVRRWPSHSPEQRTAVRKRVGEVSVRVLVRMGSYTKLEAARKMGMPLYCGRTARNHIAKLQISTGRVNPEIVRWHFVRQVLDLVEGTNHNFVPI